MRANRDRATGRRRARNRSLSDVTFVDRININTDQRQIRAPTQRRATEDWGAMQRPASQLTSKQRLASQVYNLCLDVAALRQELQALSLHRSLLHTRASFSRRASEESVVKKTEEYWHTFKHGFQKADPRQLAFLESVTAEKFQVGLSGMDVQELLEQWHLYTAYFAISCYELHAVCVVATDDVTGSCITRSDGVFRGTITRQALEMVFPAVLSDLQLTQQLLGKPITTPIAFTLHFDSQGKWSRHDTETDFVQALTDALGGDVIRAAASLREANVSNDSLLKGPHETSAYRHRGHATTRTKRPWYLAHIPVVADDGGTCEEETKASESIQ